MITSIPTKAAQAHVVMAERLTSRALPEKIKKPSYSINSLGTIDVNLAIWCISHPDIPLESLAFRDHDRLELLSAFAPPIPQDKRFEDDLMARLHLVLRSDALPPCRPSGRFIVVILLILGDIS